MKTKTARVIGFVGIDKYDLIMYASSLLVNLGNKVLLIDNSELRALSHCIGIPEALDPYQEVVNFKKIDYSCKRAFKMFVQEYDYIFVDYGTDSNNIEILECDDAVYVTDRQIHNIYNLNTTILSTVKVHLVVREQDKEKSTLKIKDILTKDGMDIKNHYSIGYDEVDKTIISSLQYKDGINIKRLSSQYKYFLKHFMMETFDIKDNDYKKAFKRIRKRGK